MVQAATDSRYSAQSLVKVVKRGAALGAEIQNVDLRQTLSDADFQVIHDALMEHQVLVFRDQDITQAQQAAFGSRFGQLTVHPFGASLKDRPEMIVLDNDQDNPPNSTDQWHSDEMFQLEPPLATLLRIRVLPPYGGDTLFASMTAAFEGLSEPMKNFLCELEAENDFKVFRKVFSRTPEKRRQLIEIEEMFPMPVHPVVRVHPVTGKRAVYVSPQCTTKIRGMREWESDHLLQMLYHLPEIPEYQYRVQWQPNTVVIWDNRSTQHYAARDYLPSRRRVERVTIKGDRPVSTKGVPSYFVRDKAEYDTRGDRTRIKNDELARPFEAMLAARGAKS